MMISDYRIKNHDRTSHNEKAKYLCDLCDFRAFTEQGLKAHKGRLHVTMADKIACSNGCGSLFNQNCSMIDHTKRNCKLDPASKEKYKLMDIQSGRTEAMKRWTEENQKKLRMLRNEGDMETD